MAKKIIEEGLEKIEEFAIIEEIQETEIEVDENKEEAEDDFEDPDSFANSLILSEEEVEKALTGDEEQLRQIALKAKQSKKNRSDERILSITGKLRAKTQDQEEKEIIQALRASQINQSYITGRVMGFENIGNDTCAVVRVGMFKGLIPSADFADFDDVKSRYRSNPDNQVFNTESSMIKSLMRRYLNAEIDFIVKAAIGHDTIDNEQHIFFASRIAALKKKQLVCWDLYRKTARGAMVKDGKRVEARVIALQKSSIIVEIHGVVTMIPSSELSWTHVDTPSSICQVGEFITVVVTDIQKTNKGYTCKASHKATKRNKQLDATRFLAEDGVYVGRVTGKGERYVYTLVDDDFEVRCYPQGQTSHILGVGATTNAVVGDYVSIKIIQINTEKARIYGRILKVNGNYGTR